MSWREIRVRVLLVNGSGSLLVKELLRSCDHFSVECVDSTPHGENGVDAIVVDITHIDDFVGGHYPRSSSKPVVVFADNVDVESAALAIRLGAEDVIRKSELDRDRITSSIVLAVERYLRRKAGAVYTKPVWDERLRLLSFNGEVVKRFRRQSTNQERVLHAFEEEGWPGRIDDPLPPKEGIDNKERLRATIRSLNGGHTRVLVRFLSDGTGGGVLWELADPS